MNEEGDTVVVSSVFIGSFVNNKRYAEFGFLRFFFNFLGILGNCTLGYGYKKYEINCLTSFLQDFVTMGRKYNH